MSASLHLARYRPRRAMRLPGIMARHGGRLRAVPGVAQARLCFVADLDTVFGGSPNPLCWALLCGWESADARDEALGNGAADPYLAGAEETWSVRLDTVRVRQGSWHGWEPSTDGVRPLARDEPVAVLTYGHLYARHLPAFTVHNRTIVRALDRDPSHTFRIGIADHALARATFSLWRTQGDMVRFSYGQDTTHDPIQRRSQAAPWARDWFFARFRPVASSGTWQGRDPLAVTG